MKASEKLAETLVNTGLGLIFLLLSQLDEKLVVYISARITALYCFSKHEGFSGE